MIHSLTSACLSYLQTKYYEPKKDSYYKGEEKKDSYYKGDDKYGKEDKYYTKSEDKYVP